MTEFEQDSNFILQENISVLEILLKACEVYYFV